MKPHLPVSILKAFTLSVIAIATISTSHASAYMAEWGDEGQIHVYDKSTYDGDLVLGYDTSLVFEFPTSQSGATPFLTINGDLRLEDSSTVVFENLSKDGIYGVASFQTLTGDTNDLLAYLPSFTKSKDFVWVTPDNTLTVVIADSVHSYSGSNQVWQNGSGFSNSGKTTVVLGRGASTTVSVIGKVTPQSVLMAQDQPVVLKDGGSGNISGAAQLVKMGNGTLGIEMTNTFTGGTLIKQGTILTRTPKALGTGSVSLSGGTLHMYSVALANNVYLNSSAKIRGGSAFRGNLVLSRGTTTGDPINLISGKTATLRSGTLKNNLVGAGKVVKDTTGSVNLYGTNTFYGGTTIKAGTLISRSLKALGAGKVTMTGGTLNMMSYAAVNTIDVDSASSAIIKGSTKMKGNFILTKGTVSGDAINLISTKMAALKSGTLKNKLTGSGKVVKSTSGVVNLTSASTYTGGTELKGGTLVTKNPTALGTGKVTVTGGTLDICCKNIANSVEIDATKASILRGNKFAGNMTLNRGILSGDAININAGKNAVLNKGTVNNRISGEGNVYKKTSGAVTLAGTNNWTGNTYVQAGTLTITGNTTLFGTVRTYAGATLDVKNTAYFMNMYLGGGTLTATNTTKIIVPGTLTLGSATRLNVSALGNDSVNFLSYGTLSNKSDWDLTSFFGLNGTGYIVQDSNGNLIISRGVSKPKKLAAPDLTMPEAAEEEEPTIAARDITEDELRTLLGTSAPVYAAELGSLAQSAWGAARSARLFDHTVRDHGGHATSLSLDGQGTRSAWFAAMSGFSRVRAEGAAMGADNSTYGGVVGMQFNGALGGNAGIAIGQSYGKVSPMGASHVDQQTQHAAIYGTKTLYTGSADCVQLTGTVSYGTTDSDCNSNGHGFEWTQHSVVLGARGTWAHAIGHDTNVYTFAGLEYLATDSGDTENGKSGSVQDFQGAIGAGVSHAMGKLTLHADAAFEYDLVRHNPVAESAGRRSTVSNPGRIGVEVRAGANYRINDRWNAEAGYSCHAAQHDTSHEAHIGASYSF